LIDSPFQRRHRLTTAPDVSPSRGPPSTAGRAPVAAWIAAAEEPACRQAGADGRRGELALRKPGTFLGRTKRTV